MSTATAEDRSRNWLEMPPHLVPLFELDCVPDPDARRTPRPQPRPRNEVAAEVSDQNADTIRKPARSTPRPQPAPRTPTNQGADHGLGKPPLCTLPPAKPLPSSTTLPPLKLDGWSFETRKQSRAADPTNAASDVEPDFLRDALKEIEDARAEKSRASAAALAAPPAKSKSGSAENPILLDLAHPLHAELQQTRKMLRGAWISMIVLMFGVVGGVVYTSARLETSDEHIERLLSQLDAEKTVSTTYKQEIANLYRELNDVKAEKSRVDAREHFASVAE